jgi:metallophosphoesterase superfamily enzyme
MTASPDEGVVATLDEHPEVKEVWFLGDLHHTHAWVHVDVQAFWLKWLQRLASESWSILVGNHDQAPSGNHALQWYESLDGVRL